MSDETGLPTVHPEGEQPLVGPGAMPGPTAIDSFAGPLRVEWDTTRNVTALGQLPFFIDFLKTSGRFDAWVADCPLAYASPNAPAKRDVLGTLTLSVLAGHQRYAHITSLRGDAVVPALLGMRRIVSEDAVRRGLGAIDEATGPAWQQRHIDQCVMPLLGERYIVDIDTTVKPLYGRQEGAVVGYNPKKPGRPSHVHHTYWLAGLRLVMGVETLPGNEHTGAHATPGLWALIDRLPRDHWPTLLRGDCGITSERLMREAERRAIAYLFKLRLTANVKRLIKRLFFKEGWIDAGQGWQGLAVELRLTGWSRQRRVVVLRRKLKGNLVATARDEREQLQLGFAEIEGDGELFEYAVLVTSLDAEILSVAQLYRDRADCENGFDELKNQWGWGGFTTRDLARCKLAAQTVALVYNWWSIFTRLAAPDKHLEAITSRPLLLNAIAECTRHARQTTLRVASSHGRAAWAQSVLDTVAGFLRSLNETAEQLTVEQRWARILAHAVRAWLDGRPLRAPPRLAAAA